MDITDIHSEVEAGVLEEKVVKIFERLGCNTPSNHIEACHRISKKSATVIIKFSRRKNCQQLFPYHKVLRSKSKKLHCLGKVNSFFILGD